MQPATPRLPTCSLLAVSAGAAVLITLCPRLHCRVGNKPLTITFAEPRRADVAAEQQQEIKSIFIGNLPDTANEVQSSFISGVVACGRL